MPFFDDALFDGSDANQIAYPPIPPSGYLGRFQQGQIVPLAVYPVDVLGFPTAPDSTPTVSLTDPSSNLLFTRKVPMDGDSLHFLSPLFLDFGFTILGRFNIEYTYFISGVQTIVSGSFDLVGGGDGAGTIISLISYTRPDAIYICAQTSSGRLMQGKNPQLYSGS
jgi:hypothetical protein